VKVKKRMSPQHQTWDPDRYERNARFVSDLGMPVFELLAARSGERILDLGCGDGVLTQKIAALGCAVVGVDGSREQIEAARGRGLEAYVGDCQRLSFRESFDAVFSNAALHWMKQADDVIDGVWRALKPGGRFVAECGGHGGVARIVAALYTALSRRGVDGPDLNPWYFATVEDYTRRLEARGFVVVSMALIARPTPLPGDIAGWLETFAEVFIHALPEPTRAEFISEVRELLRPQLCDAQGNWTADYVRLRFAATKPQEV
jgi:SAM-dependent methyltransferase